MLPEAHIQALHLIASRFSSAGIDWRLVGSTGLALQGVAVMPKDIDLAVRLVDVPLVQTALTEYCTEPMAFRASDQFRSSFGRFRIFDVKVDVMADLEIFTDGQWVRSMAVDEPAELINLDGLPLPCLNLGYALQAYIRMNRPETVRLIQARLDEI